MVELSELGLNGVGDGRVAMAMNVGPKGRDSIQIPSTSGVIEVSSLSPLYH